MLENEAKSIGKKHNESMNLMGPLRKDGTSRCPEGLDFPLLLVQFMKDEHAIETFQIMKDHENLPFLIMVWHIHQSIQLGQKLQGTILPLRHMNQFFFG